MSSHEQWSSWGSGPLLLAASNCPVCGGPKSGGCKPASRLGRGGWLCRRSPEAQAQKTSQGGFLCVHISSDGGGWSTWLPEAELVDHRPGRPGETTAETQARQAVYRRELSELLGALAAAAERLVAADAAALAAGAADGLAPILQAAETAERLALTPEERHHGYLQLLACLATTELTGDRLTLLAHRLGTSLHAAQQLPNVWAVGEDYAGPTAPLPTRWLTSRLALPVPGAVRTGNGLSILAPAGCWWPVLGLNGAILGIEVQSDSWQRLLDPDAPKYRPLSREGTATPSPWTWRVPAGPGRLEPPLGIYGPGADGVCSSQELRSARWIGVTEGRALKPRLAAARWGMPVIGGHGHANTVTMRQQFTQLLRQSDPGATVLLLIDAGGVRNQTVLTALLATAALCELAGRSCAVAWWGQSYKESPGAFNLRRHDPDELEIVHDLGPDGEPQLWLRSPLELSPEQHQQALAWLAEETPDRARGLEIHPWLPRVLGIKESGSTPRHYSYGPESTFNSQGEPCWRWAVTLAPIELLPVAEFLGRCIPPELVALDAQQREVSLRQQLLLRWHSGEALLEAGGSYRPPLPPNWPGAIHYRLADRALTLLAQFQITAATPRTATLATLDRWAQEDGVPEDVIGMQTELQLEARRQRAAMVAIDRPHPNALTQAALMQQARRNVLAEHYSELARNCPGRVAPGAPNVITAHLLADVCGSGKTHDVAAMAPALAHSLGLIGVLWLTAEPRNPATETLRQNTRSIPPTRHNGWFRELSTGRVERRPGTGEPPHGYEWAEQPSCRVPDHLDDLRARGFGNAAISDWCQRLCPHQEGCGYRAALKAFWSTRASRDGEAPTVNSGDFVTASPAMIPALGTLAKGWLSRVLVVADELPPLLGAAVRTDRFSAETLHRLHRHVRGASSRQRMTRAEVGCPDPHSQLLAQRLECVAELLELLAGLASKRHGQNGLSPAQLRSRRDLSGWRQLAQECGLAQDVILATEGQGQAQRPGAAAHLQELDRQLDRHGTRRSLQHLQQAAETANQGGDQQQERQEPSQGQQQQQPKRQHGATPPLLWPLVLAALGADAHHGHHQLSLATDTTEEGTGSQLVLTRPSGAGRLLAQAGRLLLLDATATSELAGRVLSATPDPTTRRQSPVAITTLQTTDRLEQIESEEQPEPARPGAAATGRPRVRVLQVPDIGGLTRSRRSSFTAVRNALVDEIGDWIQAAYGAGAGTGVIDHKKFLRKPAQIPPGLLERYWFGSGARGGNAMQSCRGLVLLGQPVANLNAIQAQLQALGGGTSTEAQGQDTEQRLQLELAAYQAQLTGAELVQALGRLRLWRHGPDWSAAIVLAGDADYGRVIADQFPELLGTGTYGDGIEHVGATWFGDQLGRGDQGLVAQAQSTRASDKRQAQQQGQSSTRRSTDATKRAAARERILLAIQGQLREHLGHGTRADVAARWITPTKLGNAVGMSTKTVTRHLAAMVAALPTAQGSSSVALSAPDALQRLVIYLAGQL